MRIALRTSANGKSFDVAGEGTGEGEDKEEVVEVKIQVRLGVCSLSVAVMSCSLVMFLD
jgi:hypothetical protein